MSQDVFLISSDLDVHQGLKPKQNKWTNLLEIETGSVLIFQTTTWPSFQVQENSKKLHDVPQFIIITLFISSGRENWSERNEQA